MKVKELRDWLNNEGALDDDEIVIADDEGTEMSLEDAGVLRTGLVVFSAHVIAEDQIYNLTVDDWQWIVSNNELRRINQDSVIDCADGLPLPPKDIVDNEDDDEGETDESFEGELATMINDEVILIGEIDPDDDDEDEDDDIDYGDDEDDDDELAEGFF